MLTLQEFNALPPDKKAELKTQIDDAFVLWFKEQDTYTQETIIMILKLKGKDVH